MRRSGGELPLSMIPTRVDASGVTWLVALRHRGKHASEPLFRRCAGGVWARL